MIRTKIKQVGIKCLVCGDEIYSAHRRDFKRCKCKRVAIDGGDELPRYIGHQDHWETIERDAYKFTKTKEELKQESEQLIMELLK